MTTYIFVYAGGLFLATLLVPLVIHIAKALNIYDAPGVRKVHANAVPRVGGVAIYLAVLGVTVSVLFLDESVASAFAVIRRQVLGLLAAGTLVFAVGLVDDFRGLRARTKLAAQLLAALGLCALGVRIEGMAVEGWFAIKFGWLAWPLTVFWIVAITNAVNLIDGLDGLAAGICAIVCAVIAVFSLHTGQMTMAVLMLALVGSLSGFLLFNFNPARVFMGDCGSLFLGFVIAGASVVCASKSATLVGLALPVLALGIPIFDTLFTMTRRILERRHIFSPDRGHIHHRLLDMGLRHGHVVIFIYVVTLVAAGLGMFMMVVRHTGALMIFLCVLAMVVMVFRVVGAIRLRETIVGLKRNMKINHHQKARKREFDTAVLLMGSAKTFGQWWEAIGIAGAEMDLVWLSMDVTDRDGTVRTLVWRNPKQAPAMEDMIDITLPVRQRRAGQLLRMQVAVAVNGSLEFSGHRIALFTRLVDEHSVAHLPWLTSGVARPTRVDSLEPEWRGRLVRPVQGRASGVKGG